MHLDVGRPDGGGAARPPVFSIRYVSRRYGRRHDGRPGLDALPPVGSGPAAAMAHGAWVSRDSCQVCRPPGCPTPPKAPSSKYNTCGHGTTLGSGPDGSAKLLVWQNAVVRGIYRVPIVPSLPVEPGRRSGRLGGALPAVCWRRVRVRRLGPQRVPACAFCRSAIEFLGRRRTWTPGRFDSRLEPGTNDTRDSSRGRGRGSRSGRCTSTQSAAKVRLGGREGGGSLAGRAWNPEGGGGGGGGQGRAGVGRNLGS